MASSAAAREEPMGTILVTGASGNVGQEVVRALQKNGARVIAGDRQPERARELLGDRVTAVRLDFHDRDTWPAALEGANHLFLMRPPAIADVENNLNPFVDAARARGVDHVVFLSVAGAGKNKLVPHRKVEDHLRARGDHHTNLRPGFFAQNLQSAYRDDIVQADRIYVPAGTTPVNWIDVRDIADVTALVLAEPERHRGQNYTLAGPGPVPWSVVTDALTAALGRPIRYEPASVLGYVRHLSRRGLPRTAILVQTLLHFLLRFGQGATVDPTLERLLGRPGRGVREYIADHAALWVKRPEAS
ncbi:MAG TPA: SDR family NAD(P)-dependent oxidoreductase [Vicinamibacterales bacterium]|nr:SDR family NAD(P)-dependent oxidoreductase [Vicinamibacterales bacterium]